MEPLQPWLYGVLLFLALVLLLVLVKPIHVPRTVQFDAFLPSTEINGYRFHTEVFGAPDSPPIIVVHGGPGQGYGYMSALKDLSDEYRVIFYDQRGAGLSPRVGSENLSIDQNLDDLHAIIEHFSSGSRVKLIGHSWGGALVIAYLSEHPERVSQAVVIEPAFLYPGAPVREWSEQFRKEVLPFWDIAPNLVAYPFVRREDGQEGYDYVATRVANKNRPGPPYNCPGQGLPPHTFQRLGYEAYRSIYQPIIDDPGSFTGNFTDGISEYHGDLMLISTECSILGHEFQEKYNLPRLPAQTVHVRAANTGHNVLTLEPEWSLRTIGEFFTPDS
jgi:proline iminopeptidase